MAEPWGRPRDIIKLTVKEKKESKRKNGYVTLPVFPIRLHTIVFLSPLLERYWVAIDFFFLLATLWGYGILVPWTGTEPKPSTMKARSPNHWTTREFQRSNKIETTLPNMIWLANRGWAWLQRLIYHETHGAWASGHSCALLKAQCLPGWVRKE